MLQKLDLRRDPGTLRPMDEHAQRPPTRGQKEGAAPRRPVTVKKVRRKRVPRGVPGSSAAAQPRASIQNPAGAVVRRKVRKRGPARTAAAAVRATPRASEAQRPPPGLRPQDRPRGDLRADAPSYDVLAVVGRALRHMWQRVLPAMGQASIAGAGRVAQVVRLGGATVWRHREIIGAVSTRALWWGALALLAVVGQALLAGDATSPWIADALVWFCVGLAACTVVTVAARPRHLRIAGAALATGHGAFALLHHLTTTPPT